MKHTFVVLAYKESKYLESCIQSVLNQEYKSNVMIVTSTPNDYIFEMANKYGLEVIVNQEQGKGIGFDFDFAANCGATELVTIAHQDDIYEREYSKNIVELYEKYSDSTILFSDYFEVRNNSKVYTNRNLKIKRILLTLMKFHKLSKYQFIKRSCLAFGNAICCPAVTFATKNIPFNDYFSCDMKCDIDWYAWEKISKVKGRFIFIPKPLMGHRVHEESTTTEIIGENLRTQEDYIMFRKFWPKLIAKTLNRFYVESEKSNKV